MLGRVDLARLSLRRVPLAQARSLAEGAESCVGHAQTAALFADELARPVACARSTVSLAPGDRLLVGQYSGPRLAEGATSLPEGSEIAWWWVEVGR
jgi:hypothetical protein